MALKAHSCAALSLFLAVLLFSADTILLKTHRKLSTSASQSVFWMSVFTGAFELMFALYLLDGPYEVWKNLRDDASRYTWLAVFCHSVYSGCGSFALVYGLDISLILLLFAMSPLWAALMDKLFFSKSIRIHTMVAIFISIGALAFATIPAIFKLNLSNKKKRFRFLRFESIDNYWARINYWNNSCWVCSLVSPCSRERRTGGSCDEKCPMVVYISMHFCHW